MDFKGKKVLITGASRGIGKSIAVEFARAGAHIGLNYCSNDDAAKNTLDSLNGNGHVLLKYNISDSNQAERLIEHFVNEYGTIDILINNAAISKLHPIEDIDFDTWQQTWSEIIQTNLIGVANLCYLASKVMIKNKSGRIVNISSRGAYRGEPEQMAYGASKSALNSLTQSLAKSLGKHNIIVNAIAPGFTETDMGLEFLTDKEKKSLLAETPLSRMATPEEVARGVLYLASDYAEYSSGSILDLNGASYFR